jgi:hypothetical protein
MLGPAIGYALASLCLKFYISPTLTPTIGTDDPRWLGAWWFGEFGTHNEIVYFVTFVRRCVKMCCMKFNFKAKTNRRGAKTRGFLFLRSRFFQILTMGDYKNA